MHYFDWQKDLGDLTALIHRDRAWSHRSLDTHAADLVLQLQSLHLSHNAPVLIVLPNSPEAAIAHKGVLLAGFAAVPLSPNSPPALISKIATHVGAEAIITTAAVASRYGFQVVSVGHLAYIVGRIGSSRNLSSQASSDLSYILYSSGTTAEPKAVAETYAISPAIPLHPAEDPTAETIACALPFYHGMGRTALFRMWSGSKLVLIEPFDACELLRAMEKYHVTRVSLVPSMGETLLRIGGQFDLSSLTHVMIGGSPVLPEMLLRLESLFGTRPVVGYGLTEGGHISTAMGGKLGSVGRRQHPGKHVRIVDEQGIPVSDGQTGIVQFENHTTGRFYYNDPALTSRTFTNGWIYTGDLGFLDEDGDLFLVGRHEEAIQQLGVKVTPRDIEAVICGFPGVRECAVIGIPDHFVGERVVAFVVPESDHDLEAVQLMNFCGQHLDEGRLPANIRFTNELPRTELGKISKRVLREQFIAEQNRDRDTAFVKTYRRAEPEQHRGIIQHEIVGLFQKILKTDNIALDLSFGELGVTSLFGVHFAGALEDLVGRPIPATICFEYPTITALVTYVLSILNDAEPKRLPKAVAAPAEEPVAIIGMGCRFPGNTENAEQFWDLLESGKEGVEDIPNDRWDVEPYFDATPGTPGKTYAKVGAFVKNIGHFNARAWSLSPAEARKISIHEALALEVVRRTLQSAGVDPSQIAPEKAGVFVGAMAQGGRITGTLSYRLNWQGPSVAIDSECASSLAAVHLALRSLRSRECDVALAGGVFVLAGAHQFIGPSQLRLLSVDGRCKTFDAGADGIGLGEGGGFVLLKRLSDAERDQNRIIAVVRGSAINHGGRSSSPTAPNVKAVAAVLDAALQDARVKPEEIGYIETHGTGTALGDPLEVRAITLAFGKSRTKPLALGALKPNIGHLHAASGIAGLIKAALVVERGQIPKNINFASLNPLLQAYAKYLTFPRSHVTWPAGDGQRIAGVTALGLSGTNVHVVVEQPPLQSNEETHHTKQASPVQPAQCEDGQSLVQVADRPTIDTDLIEKLRFSIADIIDCSPAALGLDDDLLDKGMDSLRLLDFLSEVREVIGIQCQPSEFMARPRLRDFASHLAAMSPDAGRPQAVMLRKGGSLPPIVCIHAIGGEVTPYMSLTNLLAPDQPVCAIQSSVLDRGDRSIRQLARTYSDIIQDCYPEKIVTLLGWSMGAILAHAVACELDRRGRQVSAVLMLDPPRQRSTPWCDPLWIAIISTAYALNPAATSSFHPSQLRDLKPVLEEEALQWCIDNELLRNVQVAPSQFRSMVTLRMNQMRAVREHTLEVCNAPVKIWWASERDGAEWDPFSKSRCYEHVIPSDHFSIIRVPAINEIAAHIGAYTTLPGPCLSTPNVWHR